MKLPVSLILAALFGVATANPSLAQETKTEATTEAAPATQAVSATDAMPVAAPVAAPVAEAAPNPAPVADGQANFPKEILDVIGKPEAGKALIVFFRPNRFVGWAIGFKVREEKAELGKLRNGTYFLYHAEPGTHAYTVHAENKDVTNMEVEEGETYFVMGEVNMGLLSGRPNLTPSTAVNFQAEIGKMKLAKALD